MYVCPKCNSEDCKKLSLLYEQGRASGTITTYTGINAFTNSSTMASQSASPPMNPLMVGCLWSLVCGFFWFISPFILAIFFHVINPPKIYFYLLLANILLIPLLVVTSAIAYPSKKRSWNRTYQCQRCATYFRIDPN